jgi:hypothetical protein
MASNVAILGITAVCAAGCIDAAPVADGMSDSAVFADSLGARA